MNESESVKAEVVDPATMDLLPMKRNRRQTERQRMIADFVRQYRPVLSPSEMSTQLTKKIGSTVSRFYISRVMQEIDEHDKKDLSGKSSLDLALESRNTYKRLEDEGFQMFVKAFNIVDPLEKAKVQTMAMNQIRMAREAHDRMYKYMGITAETFRLEHIDITTTSQWKNLLKGILIYVRHVVQCPKCGFRGFSVEHMVEFLDNVRDNPTYVEQFFSYKQKQRQAMRDGYDGFGTEEKDASFDQDGTTTEETVPDGDGEGQSGMG